MSVLGTWNLLAGRYRLREQIAAGGTGEVWRADDEVLGREVAVKMLRPEYAGHTETLARFQAEARHAGRLAHPNIVQIYDYGQDGDARVPFLVMELVDGPSLASVLADGPLQPPRVLDMIGQVAAGLAAAHAVGLVHRDIKPANLLLAPDDVVKITDFGIASAAGSARLTQSGMVPCTPGYLAPERAAGNLAGPASDLYALGVVAWESLTGEPPFTGTPLEVALAHMHRDLPPLPAAVPAGLAAVVAALAARNPAARPDSAAVVARVGQLRSERPAAPSPLDQQGGQPAQMPATLSLTGITYDVPHAPPLDDPLSAPPLGAPPLGHRPHSSLKRPRLAALLSVAALVVAGGLAAFLVVASPGSTSQTPASATAPSVPAASTVRIDAASLRGLPAATVLAKLRQAGLRPHVVEQPSAHSQPGTVVAIQPSGPVPVGSPVTVTVATGPPGHGHHGKVGSSGNGDNGGDGG